MTFEQDCQTVEIILRDEQETHDILAEDGQEWGY